MTDIAATTRLWIAAIAAALLVAMWVALSRTPFPGAAAQPSSTTTAPTGGPTTTPAMATPREVAALHRRAVALQARARRVAARRDLAWARYRSQVAEQASAPSTTAVSGGASTATPTYVATTTPSQPPATSTRSS